MKSSLSFFWWGIVSTLIIGSSIFLTQADLQAQPSGAPGAEEPFDFESFFKELTKEIEKVEAESTKKAPESPAPIISQEIPQRPVLPPSSDESLTSPISQAAPLLSAPEEQTKRDPVSLFTKPTLKTIETERQKITEPTDESIAAFHTILDDNLTARMEPTRVGLITHLSELETKILGTVSPVSEHFKNDYRTLYQKTLNRIILLINQIGSNPAYIKLFLVPPQEEDQSVASLRAKIIDCLQATKNILSKITISDEEKEPIGLLKKLAERPTLPHHHHPEHPQAEYQHALALSPLEKSIINVLERLKPIETGLTNFVASKDYQEAIKKLVSAEKTKEKEARARQEQKALGGFAPWRDYFTPRTTTPSIAPRTMPSPWWNDPSWLNTGESSSSYAPGMFPITPTGTGMPMSTTGATPSTQKTPVGKVKVAEDDKGGHGRALEEDASQKAFNRALNAINQATGTVHQTLESIKGMAPDDAARHLLNTGTISKITHQLEQIAKMKLDLPEEQPSVQAPEAMGRGISVMGKTAQAGRIKSDHAAADQQKKIKKSEQELNKNLAKLSSYILRANTIQAPEGREQEQKKISSLYQYVTFSPHIVNERAQELLNEDQKELERQIAIVRSPENIAALKQYFDDQKRMLEKKAAQFPVMPKPFQKRLEIIGNQLQQIGTYQEQEAAKN